MVGKGSVRHNNRDFTAENIDAERTRNNITYCNENIKDVYHKLFDEALEKFNARQTRKDRMIDDYYEKIRTGKQEKLQKVKIVCGYYKNSAEFIDKHTFVYFDPPYRPLTETASFTDYTENLFNDEEQFELAEFVESMHKKGAIWIMGFKKIRKRGFEKNLKLI